MRRTSQFTRGHDFDDGGFAVLLRGACLAQRVPDLIDRINGDAYTSNIEKNVLIVVGM
jgi:hypothetical protein